MRTIWFAASLVVAIIVVILLASGSSILNIPLDKKNTVPLGTFITWIGIIALPLSIYWGVKKLRMPQGGLYKAISILLKVALALAILWVPVCYLLAGNLSFSFSEKETFQGGQLAMRLFWIYSYGVVGLSLFVLLIHWMRLLIKGSFKIE